VNPSFLLTALQGGVTLVSGIAVAGLAYVAVSETGTIVTETVTFSLPRLSEEFDGLRVAQISDLHFRPYTGEREIQAAVEAVNAAHPDLIVLTGDYVTSTWLFHFGQRTADGVEDCAEILKRLHAPLGIFAVLGNHDWNTDADRISEALKSAGIRVLRNEAVALERGNSRLWIAGTDDAYVHKADLDRTLAGIPADEPVLLLAHEPDFADVAARYPVDVQFSGHAHGGQIFIPGVGAPYLPPMGRKYVRGHYKVGDMHLYANRGIGVHGAPMRFYASPEVTIAQLRTS
jgi:predicted MPP superfamily phosphohydrolase